MKIMLLGANGQVGWELRRSLSLIGDVISYGHREANFEDLEGLRALVKQEAPDLIVNAAAYTNVDKSESVPDHAILINSKAVAVLAESAKALKIPLIHYSTDYVYDGNKVGLYDESDETAPLNVYGQSKLKGEAAIIASGCDHLIFRTSWVYDSRNKNFIKTILRLAFEGRKELPVICDQFGAPTSAELIADVTALILSKMCLKSMGKKDLRWCGQKQNIYHLVAAGETNWCDYAKYILDQAQECGYSFALSSEEIRPILAKDYKLAAKRPANSRLSLDKIQSTFDIKIPHWQPHVARAVSEIVGVYKDADNNNFLSKE